MIFLPIDSISLTKEISSRDESNEGELHKMDGVLRDDVGATKGCSIVNQY